MSKLNEIMEAIESLPEKEYHQLRQWFIEMDWGKWDPIGADFEMRP